MRSNFLLVAEGILVTNDQIPNSKFQIPNSKFQNPKPKTQQPAPVYCLFGDAFICVIGESFGGIIGLKDSRKGAKVDY